MTDWVRAQKDNSNSRLSCKAATVISWHDAKYIFFFSKAFSQLIFNMSRIVYQSKDAVSEIWGS